MRAVNKTHPPHRKDLALQYESSAKFIDNFGTVASAEGSSFDQVKFPPRMMRMPSTPFSPCESGPRTAARISGDLSSSAVAARRCLNLTFIWPLLCCK